MITLKTGKLSRCLLGMAGAALIGMQSPVLAREDHNDHHDDKSL